MWNVRRLSGKREQTGQIFRGQIDKYTWVDAGSSYLPGDMNAAYLMAQLDAADEIFEDRMRSWNLYYELLKPLEEKGKIALPHIPENCMHNAHMFLYKSEGSSGTQCIDFISEGK